MPRLRQRNRSCSTLSVETGKHRFNFRSSYAKMASLSQPISLTGLYRPTRGGLGGVDSPPTPTSPSKNHREVTNLAYSRRQPLGLTRVSPQWIKLEIHRFLRIITRLQTCQSSCLSVCSNGHPRAAELWWSGLFEQTEIRNISSSRLLGVWILCVGSLEPVNFLRRGGQEQC